jgi:hypothetical protein
MTDIGAIPIDPPFSGKWPLVGYPEVVRWRGREFRRATWTWPYENVVAQYREVADRNAMHMLVYSSGRFVIDHLDEANPDRGLVLEHAVLDVAQTPVGAVIKTTAVMAGLALGAVAIGGLFGAMSRRN